MIIRITPRDVDLSVLQIKESGSEDIEVPFEFSSKDFLDFASEDLKGKSTRDTVNALGNIKRSIDCLVDSLLFVINFLEDSKGERWTFPEKMSFLGEIGIITPYILGKINSMRNLLEHEFKEPIREEVDTAYDVAILFYYATVRFTKVFLDHLILETKDETWGIAMDLNRENRNIEIAVDSGNLSVSWDKTPEDYKKWMYIFYQAQYLCV